MAKIAYTYSVVIPCYNCEQTVGRALEYASRMSMAPEEVICVDNNSTDKTYEVLLDFSKKMKNLRVVQEFKQGASAARNKGASLATGDYIQFLDADDILLETKVEHQLQLASDPKFNRPPLIIGAFRSVSREEEPGGNVELIKEVWVGLIRGLLGYTVSNLWPRELFTELGGFDVELKTSEEYLLLFNYLKSGAEAMMTDICETVKINDNEFALTRLNQEENWERFLSLRERIYHFLKKEGMMDNSTYSAFFDVVRTGYRYNQTKAVEFYKQLLKGNFTPIPSSITSSDYLKVYNVVGFPTADRLIRMIRK
ncbi:MAG: glycosyltransferase family 2 protein [Flavobacteriales bacterium]|nr:glycosyltransferase family 2 protein [Flavobacteriales bacterium]